MNRIRFWPLRRDDQSCVLIGAGGTLRSVWPARVLAYDVSTSIDRLHAWRNKQAWGMNLGPIVMGCIFDFHFRNKPRTLLLVRPLCRDKKGFYLSLKNCVSCVSESAQNSQAAFI